MLSVLNTLWHSSCGVPRAAGAGPLTRPSTAPPPAWAAQGSPTGVPPPGVAGGSWYPLKIGFAPALLLDIVPLWIHGQRLQRVCF
jgi:hypothetical protein